MNRLFFLLVDLAFFTGGAKWPLEDHFSKHHLLGLALPALSSRVFRHPRHLVPLGQSQFPILNIHSTQSYPGVPSTPEGKGSPQKHCSGLPFRTQGRQLAEKRRGPARAQKSKILWQKEQNQPLELCLGVYQVEVGVGRFKRESAHI